jgi:hypothetical protein
LVESLLDMLSRSCSAASGFDGDDMLTHPSSLAAEYIYKGAKSETW